MFTGMSGSGKTTLSSNLKNILESEGLSIEHIKFDEIRHKYVPEGIDPYSKDPRVSKMIYERVTYSLRNNVENGNNIILDTGAGLEKNRKLIQDNIPNHILVYLQCPLYNRILRETIRSIYGNSDRGNFLYLRSYIDLHNPLKKNKFPMTGVTKPYEVPHNPSLTISTDKTHINESTQIIFNHLTHLGYI